MQFDSHRLWQKRLSAEGERAEPQASRSVIIETRPGEDVIDLRVASVCEF